MREDERTQGATRAGSSPNAVPQVVAWGEGGKREQAGLIKAFTARLPSSLILFKLSHLPTLNGKLSQLLPVSPWGKQLEEGGKGGKGCRAASGWDLQCSHRGACCLLRMPEVRPR